MNSQLALKHMEEKVSKGVLKRLSPKTRAAPQAPPGISLLFPMNELFEAYVAALARRALAPHGIEVQAQGGFLNCLWELDDEGVERRQLFSTKPDLILRRHERPLAIVDTK